MKKVPKWCLVGFLISLILFIIGIKLYIDHENQVKKYIIQEKHIIQDVEYKYRNHNKKPNRKYTIATIKVDNKEYTVEIPGHDNYIGEEIEIYKYKDNYYFTIGKMIYISGSNSIIFLCLGIFGTFFFFPFQIICYLTKNDKLFDLSKDIK